MDDANNPLQQEMDTHSFLVPVCVYPQASKSSLGAWIGS